MGHPTFLHGVGVMVHKGTRGVVVISSNLPMKGSTAQLGNCDRCLARNPLRRRLQLQLLWNCWNLHCQLGKRSEGGRVLFETWLL
jgi:hypothetical protein